MLDEFSAAKLDSKPAETTSSPGPPVVTAGEGATPEDVLSDDEFAKQLQAGMADLLGEIESSVRRISPGTG